MTFRVIIPARYASQRLPGKPLLDLCGKPMIQHVVEQAMLSDADSVIVATDDARIEAVVKHFGAEVVMTKETHPSGTDRLQEVVDKLGLADDAVVVNVQGDEPLMPPEVINQVAANLAASESPMATLYEPIENQEDLDNPNIVKLVSDANGQALYFSRAAIPFARDGFSGDLASIYKRHLGIYAYRVALLNEYIHWPTDDVEHLEKLEQLRVLRRGYGIYVAQAVMTIPPGIDTQEDLEHTRRVLELRL